MPEYVYDSLNVDVCVDGYTGSWERDGDLWMLASRCAECSSWHKLGHDALMQAQEQEDESRHHPCRLMASFIAHVIACRVPVPRREPDYATVWNGHPKLTIAEALRRRP